MEFFTVHKQLILKFLKFGVVGFTGMIVDFGFTYLFKEIVKIHKYVANAIGFSLAATSNYFLNRIWTFESNNPHVFVEFSEFFVISVIGLGINSLVLWVLVSKYNKHFYLAKLIAIGVTMIWNFFANYLYTFAR
jgi:putative flippase GtrA